MRVRGERWRSGGSWLLPQLRSGGGRTAGGVGGGMIGVVGPGRTADSRWGVGLGPSRDGRGGGGSFGAVGVALEEGGGGEPEEGGEGHHGADEVEGGAPGVAADDGAQDGRGDGV